MIFVSIVVDEEAEVQSCRVACPRALREEVGGRAGCDRGSLTPAPPFLATSLYQTQRSIQSSLLISRSENSRLGETYLAQIYTAE